MDKSPITLGVILPPNLHGKISTNSRISPGDLDENWNLKVCAIRILLDIGAITSIVHKDNQQIFFKD